MAKGEGSNCNCESPEEHEMMLLRITQSQRKDASGERTELALKVATSEALTRRARAGRAQLNGHS